MTEFKKFLSRGETRDMWLRRLVIAVCLSPVAITILYETAHNNERKEKLTQVFNAWKTPESLRPYIERVVIDKTATCKDIPLNPDTMREMSEKESRLYVEVCEAAQARIAAEYEYNPR